MRPRTATGTATRTATRTGTAIAVAVLATACDEVRSPPALSDAAWRMQLGANFAALEQLRTSPGGMLTWVGLWPLAEGRTAVGSAAGSGVALPAGAPATLGAFVRAGADVMIEPAPGAGLRLADGTLVDAPFRLEADGAVTPTVLAVGDLRLKVHEEPGSDHRWVRAWREAPGGARPAFTMPSRFPPNRTWRVAAKLMPSASGQAIALEDVSGGTQAFTLAGELTFPTPDGVRRLLAFRRPGRDSLFVVFRDGTSGRESYGAARYLYVQAPGPDRWTVVDFNKAHNPPCAFTAFSTCVLPPKSNRLTVRVEAGEMAPAAAPGATPPR